MLNPVSKDQVSRSILVLVQEDTSVREVSYVRIAMCCRLGDALLQP